MAYLLYIAPSPPAVESINHREKSLDMIQPKPRQDDVTGVFGARVKAERTRQQLTREQLAEAASVSVDIIKRVEIGMGAKIEVAYNIAVALHVSLGALLPVQEADRAIRINDSRLLLDELESEAK